MISSKCKEVLFKFSILRATPHPIDNDYIWYGNVAKSLLIEHSLMAKRMFSKLYSTVKKLSLYGNYYGDEDQTTDIEMDHILFP
jgi:hypothetical protein